MKFNKAPLPARLAVAIDLPEVEVVTSLAEPFTDGLGMAYGLDR